MKCFVTAEEGKSHLQSELEKVGIPAKLVDEIINHHTAVDYNKGAMIFQQGSPADIFFWIFAGLARVYCPKTDGTRTLINLAGPGDLIGHVDYINSKDNHVQAFEAQAFTRCSVALFTREHVMRLLQSLDHAALLHLIEQLNTGWSSTARWFGNFLSMSFRERLEAVLGQLGAKFGVRDTRGVLLTFDLAHSDLAEMIGGSRPMVSRLIAEMTSDGLLLRQGKQFILAGRLTANPQQSSPNRPDAFLGSRASAKTPIGMALATQPLLKRAALKRNRRRSLEPALTATFTENPNGLQT